MPIPLDLARTLAVVVDEGTIDAAARHLRITPSAVSQRIKALEQQVGRVLLVRSKPARPTEAGHAVVRLARQLALIEHDALVELGQSGETVSVPLAVNADSLGTWFLPALARLVAEHPVVFDLHRDDQDFTAGLLESGAVMGAVTSQATPVAGCLVRTLGVMRYEAVATPDFVRRWLTDGRLDAAPVVQFDRRDELQNVYLERRGFEASAPPRHFVPASQDFATAVCIGLGWGLLPGFQSRAGLASGELVRLGGEPIDVPLYWQQWNLRSPLLERIAEVIGDEASRALRV